MTPVTAAAPVAPPGDPGLAVVFLAAARSEWTKLRTVRSTVWALVLTVVAIVGLGALVTALELSRWGATPPADFDPILYSFAGLSLAQLAIGVLGVLVMTSEYATGVIRLTLAATPQRRVLLAAKVATFSVVVAVASLVSCFAAFFLCQALLGAKDAGVSITDPGVLRAVTGGAVHLVLVGVIAVALGALLRRTAGAVALLFAVLLVLPGLVQLLPQPWNDDITRYLPNAAGAAMQAVVHFPNLLSPWQGTAVLAGYAAGLLCLAAWVLARRDA